MKDDSKRGQEEEGCRQFFWVEDERKRERKEEKVGKREEKDQRELMETKGRSVISFVLEDRGAKRRRKAEEGLFFFFSQTLSSSLFLGMGKEKKRKKEKKKRCVWCVERKIEGKEGKEEEEEEEDVNLLLGFTTGCGSLCDLFLGLLLNGLSLLVF